MATESETIRSRDTPNVGRLMQPFREANLALLGETPVLLVTGMLLNPSLLDRLVEQLVGLVLGSVEMLGKLKPGRGANRTPLGTFLEHPQDVEDGKGICHGGESKEPFPGFWPLRAFPQTLEAARRSDRLAAALSWRWRKRLPIIGPIRHDGCQEQGGDHSGAERVCQREKPPPTGKPKTAGGGTGLRLARATLPMASDAMTILSGNPHDATARTSAFRREKPKRGGPSGFL